MPDDHSLTNLMFQFIRMDGLANQPTLFTEVIKMFCAGGAELNAAHRDAPFTQSLGILHPDLLPVVVGLAKDRVEPFCRIDFRAQAQPEGGFGFLYYLASNTRASADALITAIALCDGYVDPHALAKLLSRGRKSVSIAVAKHLMAQGHCLGNENSPLWGFFLYDVTSAGHASAVRGVIDAIVDDAMLSVPRSILYGDTPIQGFHTANQPILRIISESRNISDDYVFGKAQQCIQKAGHNPQEVMSMLRAADREIVACRIESAMLDATSRVMKTKRGAASAI